MTTVRADKVERLTQFKKQSKKMDEEDIEYFEADLEKVDKIETSNFKFIIRA